MFITLLIFIRVIANLIHALYAHHLSQRSRQLSYMEFNLLNKVMEGDNLCVCLGGVVTHCSYLGTKHTFITILDVI